MQIQNEAFQTLERYPELQEVMQQFEAIRREALSLKSQMIPLNDERVDANVWSVFPLLPEEEDRVVIPEYLWKKNQRLAPKTTRILSSISSLLAYSFSSLKPNGHIRPHVHENPYVTATLCLQDGGDSYIVVNGEKAQFKSGEMIIFDYRQEHEVINLGTDDRVVLLMLLENRQSIAT
jgi:aspartyl/asparaginyl beta-hydroxylase (cupin superfamily)